MKKLEFTTSKGEFIIEEASDKNLGRALIKYMTEEQFSQVVDSTKKGEILTCFKDYTKGYYSNSLFTAKESFESLVKSLGWYLWENPYGNFKSYKKAFNGHDMFYANYIDKYNQTESKTLYNPVLLKKK